MKKSLLPLLILIAFIAFNFIFGCANLTRFLNGCSTNLTSSALSSTAALTASGSAEGGNWYITPTKISGEVLSIVLPIAGEEDEGIVPFGNGRPDIAPAQSTLYPFDLSDVTTLSQSMVSTKPGFKGGVCNQIIVMFGYFDVEFTQGSSTRKIRFCYGDSDAYNRRDKLLYNAGGTSTNKFYWYDTTNTRFEIETGTRPSSPCANSYVRDFSDSIRPDMHYYMLGANLRNNTDYDGTTQDYITLSKTIVSDYELSFTVDFDVENAVYFEGVASESEFNNLTDAQLIEKFDMKQNTSNWGNTGLYCNIDFTATKKFP